MRHGQGITLFIVIAVLLGAVAGLNYIQSLNTPTEQELEQRQEQQMAAAQKAAQEKSASSPHSSSTPPARPIPGNSTPSPDPTKIAPESDLVLGNTAGTVIAVAYTMDTPTERNPAELNRIIEAVQSWSASHPSYGVKVICLDLPKDQLSNPADQNLPLGLSINGKSIGGCQGNPGEGLCDTTLVQTYLYALK